MKDRLIRVKNYTIKNRGKIIFVATASVAVYKMTNYGMKWNRFLTDCDLTETFENYCTSH